MADDWAVVGGRLATGCLDITDDPTALDSTGFWVVALTFEGALTCVRMADVQPAGDWLTAAGPWTMPATWETSLDRAGYLRGVETIRDHIAAGDVYQVNLCRLLTAVLPQPPDLRSLGGALARGNPAPYAAVVNLPAADLYVASASPELFLARDGDLVSSGPIKGTGRTEADLTDKDAAENVMIVDLRAQRPGPRQRAGLGRGAGAASGRAAPGTRAPGLDRLGAA